jgi:hypothetical protein
VTPSQLKRRQALVDRGDAALERWPERVGHLFLGEMSEVARGLETLAKEADAKGGDRLERCRTWRFAGNAYFDLGNGKELPQMQQAVSAFGRAEPLLEGCDNPIERMKLNYSFGNALFHLSNATDVTLVQHARDRYSVALNLAQGHFPVGIETAQRALTDAERLLATMQTISQLDMRKSELEGQIAGLDAEDNEAQQTGEFDDYKSLFGQLTNVYQKDVADGKLSSVRQEALNPLLDTLGSMLQRKAKNLADLTTEGSVLGELAARLTALESQTSHQSGGAAVLSSDSRAQAVWSRFATIKKDLATDIARPHSGSEEGRSGRELYIRCARADTLIHQKGNDEAWMREYERDVLRQLAADVRAYSLRYHLTLARPIWYSPPITPDPSVVFYSGAPDVRKFVARACDGLGLRLLTSPSGRSPKDYASARWDQCRTGQIAIFDYTHYRSPQSGKAIEPATAGLIASVSYELGMAVTLGRPIAIVAHEDQELPFDVSIEPVRLKVQRDMDKKYQARLAHALDDAMYSSRAGSGDSSLSAARDYLQKCFATHPNFVVSRSASLLDDQSIRDPVVFRRNVEPLVGAAGKEAPLVLFPVYPAAIRRHSRRGCFT